MDVSEKILTVGPDYKDHRGGIGAILSIYSEVFEVFNFIPTFRAYNRNYKKDLFFARQVIVFFFKVLKNRKIEVVHIHGSHGRSFFRKFIIFYISKRIFNKKVIYHLHSSTFGDFYLKSSNVRRLLIEHMIKNVDCFICVSQYWKDYYSALLGRREISLVNNIVDFPSPVTKKYFPAHVPVRLLFLGKVGPGKGIFDVIDVLGERREYFQDKVRLSIAGDGEIEKLKKILKQYELENVVNFVGWADNKLKISLLSESDVFVLPSYYEGMPVSILEAMSYGLPILSTSVGGIPEIVKDRKNGILIEPGNKDALKEAIDYFIHYPQIIEQFGKCSLETAQSYLPHAVTLQLNELYLKILGVN